MTWRVSEIDVDGWYWWICLAVVSFLARLSTPWDRGPCLIRKLLFFFFFFGLKLLDKMFLFF